MGQKKILIRNVLSNYMTQFIYGISNFVLVGYVVRTLGKEAFGLVALYMSATMVVSLLERGITQALTKYVAETVESPGTERLASLMSSSFVWYVGAGMAAGLAMVGMGFFSEQFFHIPQTVAPVAFFGWLVMALRTVVTFPFVSYQGMLRGYQRYDLVNVAMASAVLLRLLVTVLVFELFSQGIILFLWIHLATTIIERILWVFFARRLVTTPLLRWRLVRRGVLWSLLGFGSMVLINNVGNLIGYEAVKMVIGNAFSIVDVGGYTLIATIASFAAMLTRSISSVLAPAASQINARGDSKTQQLLALTATKYALVVSGAVCIVPLFLLRGLLEIWVGTRYAPAYLDMLALAGGLLLGGQWLSGLADSLLQMATGVGKVRMLAAITSSWAIGSLLLILGYVQLVDKRLLGVVVIISIGRALGSLANFAYGAKTFGLSMGQFIRTSAGRALVAAVLASGVAALLGKWVPTVSIWGLGLVGGVSMVIYGGLVWSWVLTGQERQTFRLRRA